jgi:hypothetical protein
VLVAGLVAAQRTPPRRFLDVRDHRLAGCAAGHVRGGLEDANAARASPCAVDQCLDGGRLDGDPPAEAALGIGAGPVNDGAQIVCMQRLQDQHRRAREQRRDDLERGVLGRGPDQDDGAVLDVRKERVLLRLVEAMDLVDEEDRAATPDADGSPALLPPRRAAPLTPTVRPRTR